MWPIKTRELREWHPRHCPDQFPFREGRTFALQMLRYFHRGSDSSEAGDGGHRAPTLGDELSAAVCPSSAPTDCCSAEAGAK